MSNGDFYRYSKDNVDYLSVFKFAKHLPENLSVTAVLSVPILNNKVFLVKQKDTNWWDIPGGHIEKKENWEEAIDRELKEEVGIVVDHHQIIGYFEVSATSSDSDAKLVYKSPSLIVVTLSFVQKYISDWEKPNDILDRSLVSFKELNKYLGDRSDNCQLNHVLVYAKEVLDQIAVTYDFSFVKDNIDFSFPVTQIYGFCKEMSSGNFCLVRETGFEYYGLPGGGCEIGETPQNAFKRELMEETQLVADKIKILGATKVDMYTSDKKICLQTILQIRFYAEIKEISNFVPNKDGFEIEERVFFPLNIVAEKVDWLKTDVGLLILDEVKKINHGGIL